MSIMIIKNAQVYTSEFRFEKKNLYIDGEYFSEKGSGDTVVDAEGLYVIPGLIDLHFHGCNGASFMDGTAEAIDTITEYEAVHGITAVCPSTEPAEYDRLIKALSAAANYKNSHGAVLCGINLEGPFLTYEKRGGNNGKYLLSPSEEMFEEYQRAANGLIKIMDIAPELDGSLEFIKKQSKNIVISLAHTAADYRTCMEGFTAGASMVTHLFNGMPVFHHRDTGLVGAAMDSGAYVELICDGMHVSDSMLRAAYRIFGAEKIVSISDSLFCAGLPDGHYKNDDCEIDVTDGLARLKDGTINGASSNLYDNMRHLIKAGIPRNDAIRMSTYNPAKVLNILDVTGTLEAGKWANFVITDENMCIKDVYVKGRKTDKQKTDI